jgi:large subunit ribosomal protein L22
MGARKRKGQKKEKSAKNNYPAVLRNCLPLQKMRLVTGLIRGKEVNRRLISQILQQEAREGSRNFAFRNSELGSKNEGVRLEEANLYIKKVSVGRRPTMKRLQTLLREGPTGSERDLTCNNGPRQYE